MLRAEGVVARHGLHAVMTSVPDALARRTPMSDTP
jgi:hypothetical protein